MSFSYIKQTVIVCVPATCSTAELIPYKSELIVQPLQAREMGGKTEASSGGWLSVQGAKKP